MERRIHDFLPEIKDYYTINDKGEVFSDNSGKMKTRNRAGTEYQIINFQTVDGKKKTFRVHRLVLLAFEPCHPIEKNEVNHIDGNKKNNSLENLEWITASENQQHAYRTGLNHGRKGETSNFHKLSAEDVKEIRYLYDNTKITRKELAERFHCTPSNITYIVNNKTW